jgi:saccharopine dehydrogenase (NADP+, L-glutamate forming)
MQTILVAGAGKSSTHLIDYLLSHAGRHGWTVIVADGSAAAIEEKVRGHVHGEAAAIDITDAKARQELVRRADLVVSLMPPHLHILLAKDCLQFGKHLITSSYASPEMRELDAAAKAAGLLFLCEMGLDPGIDHMTAAQIIHGTQRIAATITSFRSYCGGLVAPECDDNPWHYKFSWNPRNIVTAGFGGARFLEHGQEKYIPHENLFGHGETIRVDGLGSLAFYPNRDSLRYPALYDVPEAETFLRATLRHPDFCHGWDAVVQLGLTEENDTLDENMRTYRSWTAAKAGGTVEDVRNAVARKLALDENSPIIDMLDWLGLFDASPIPEKAKTSADALLELLLNKWSMKPTDKDMVVMQHEVEYAHKGRGTKLVSTMVLKGENRDYSAMSKTVGLPMAIFARLLLRNKVKLPTGVHIPTLPVIYKPVLTELQQHGIQFHDVVS